LLPLFWDMCGYRGYLFANAKDGRILLIVRLNYFTGHSSFAVPLTEERQNLRHPSTPLRTSRGHRGAQGKALASHIFFEHFFGVDGDEDAAAAGQDFVFVVEDFGGVDVDAAADFDFAAFHAEWFTKRNRF
jgi:hypothetical protein